MKTKAMLYQPSRPGTMWLAFVFAIVLHVTALAIGRHDLRATTSTDVSIDTAITTTIERLDEQPPPTDITYPDPPPMPRLPDDFADERPKPPAMRPTSVAAVRPVTVATNKVTNYSAVKTFALFAPRPEYTYEARRQRITGSGRALLEVDINSGSVVSAAMTQSTGNALLDNSALAAFRRWRFRAGTPARVNVPITFTLVGASY